MKIRFCGAAQFVTGSCHLIELDDGTKILLDCGLFQGKGRNIWDWNNEWLFDPSDIDAVILSHAHLDHTGRLPQLVKDGFKGHIYSTHATRSLTHILLLDSAHIQEDDVRHFNKLHADAIRSGKRNKRVPLYTAADVGPTMQQFITTGYDQWCNIKPHIRFLFRDAGHLLGSASVVVEIQENGKTLRIGYTGDIGRYNRPILRDPQPMPKVDYLIAESTYGNRRHPVQTDQKHQLLEIIRQTCVQDKGKLLIPAFSIGRTQEIVYLLDQLYNEDRLPRIPVYVDSPLAINATAIYGNHPECYDRELSEYLLTDDDPFGFNTLRYIRRAEESKKLNRYKGPCVIISAAGMAQAGRIRHHLYHHIEDPTTTVLIVGYCAPGTLGRQLMEGQQVVQIFDTYKTVRARVKVMEAFSAHGDYLDMLHFLEPLRQSTKTLFLVHGEPEAMHAYRQKLLSFGFEDVKIPLKGQYYNIP